MGSRDIHFLIKTYDTFLLRAMMNLVYQPFALIIVALLSYFEVTINAKQLNLMGFVLFNISILLVLDVGIQR